jgi:hypothetical protein
VLPLLASIVPIGLTVLLARGSSSGRCRASAMGSGTCCGCAGRVRRHGASAHARGPCRRPADGRARARIDRRPHLVVTAAADLDEGVGLRHGSSSAERVRTAGHELAARGVRLSAIELRPERHLLPGIDHGERFRERLRRDVPAQRLGESGETVELALFLAGDNSSFIFGQIISTDGGWSWRSSGPAAAKGSHLHHGLRRGRSPRPERTGSPLTCGAEPSRDRDRTPARGHFANCPRSVRATVPKGGGRSIMGRGAARRVCERRGREDRPPGDHLLIADSCARDRCRHHDASSDEAESVARSGPMGRCSDWSASCEAGSLPASPPGPGRPPAHGHPPDGPCHRAARTGDRRVPGSRSRTEALPYWG